MPFMSNVSGVKRLRVFTNLKFSKCLATSVLMFSIEEESAPEAFFHLFHYAFQSLPLHRHPLHNLYVLHDPILHLATACYSAIDL